jgi:hypothetical protein
MQLHGAVSPSKAETLMGRAFRDKFDKETFYALLKHAPDWRRCEQMVRSELVPNYAGGSMPRRRFRVALAKNARTGDFIEVVYQMPEGEMMLMHEENFVNLGEHLADNANAEVEKTYMALPDE